MGTVITWQNLAIGAGLPILGLVIGFVAATTWGVWGILHTPVPSLTIWIVLPAAGLAAGSIGAYLLLH